MITPYFESFNNSFGTPAFNRSSLCTKISLPSTSITMNPQLLASSQNFNFPVCRQVGEILREAKRSFLCFTSSQLALRLLVFIALGGVKSSSSLRFAYENELDPSLTKRLQSLIIVSLSSSSYFVDIVVLFFEEDQISLANFGNSGVQLTSQIINLFLLHYLVSITPFCQIQFFLETIINNLMVHLITQINDDLPPVHKTHQLQKSLVIQSKLQRWLLEQLIFIPLPLSIIQLMIFGIIEGQNQAKNVATKDHPKGWKTFHETLEWLQAKDPRRNNYYQTPSQ